MVYERGKRARGKADSISNDPALGHSLTNEQTIALLALLRPMSTIGLPADMTANVAKVSY
jgi:hypothetical protein